MSSDIHLRENDHVLLFWKENTELFPILSSMVHDLFAIPASNTTVERLFSSSKNTVTDRRTSLSEKKDKDPSIKNKEQLKRKISRQLMMNKIYLLKAKTILYHLQ
ncbi:unnamed protein product [Rotaria socialis]